jgi:hypothetical protein
LDSNPCPDRLGSLTLGTQLLSLLLSSVTQKCWTKLSVKSFSALNGYDLVTLKNYNFLSNVLQQNLNEVNLTWK